jgi:hypothetical protein
MILTVKKEGPNQVKDFGCVRSLSTTSRTHFRVPIVFIGLGTKVFWLCQEGLQVFQMVGRWQCKQNFSPTEIFV